ncbi:GNAT family N-acetyltransferase [Mesorhizobium sp. M1227]|uniref:GNAT family N-acetyltransferase n=1 Tax=Mesorhizobium sp. M1227 TaxID=2957071 RepID=UPI0033387334
MERTHASQIAELLNAQNQLAIKYDAQHVLDHANEYVVDLSEDGRVVCCAQLKRVQWYQAEISHVTTHFVRQGRGARLIEAAEQRARKDGARLLQCTVRTGNGPSEGMFAKAGFQRGPTFGNPQTGNNVTVWSKALIHPQNNLSRDG